MLRPSQWGWWTKGLTKGLKVIQGRLAPEMMEPEHGVLRVSYGIFVYLDSKTSTIWTRASLKGEPGTQVELMRWALQPTTPGDASKQIWQNLGPYPGPDVLLQSIRCQSTPPDWKTSSKTANILLMLATLHTVSSIHLHIVLFQAKQHKHQQQACGQNWPVCDSLY